MTEAVPRPSQPPMPTRPQVPLVDDNPSHHPPVSEVLKDAGAVHAEHASSVDEALKTTAQFRKKQPGGFDVALLDLHMPGTYGASSILRFRAGAPEVPVIVLTGADYRHLPREVVEAKAHGLLEKNHLAI